MVNQIIGALILLSFIITPVILYSNMHKSRHNVGLFLGYIIPLIYLFLKNYFTNYEIKLNTDTLIFVISVWIAFSILFELYDVLCEYVKNKK